MRKIISFAIVITFLFTNIAYSSDILRPNIMTNGEKERQRLQVAAAHEAVCGRKYVEAYDLVMEYLLGEELVVNMEMTIKILERIKSHWGYITYEGKLVQAILDIVIKHQNASDQSQMKVELKEFERSFWERDGKRKLAIKLFKKIDLADIEKHEGDIKKRLELSYDQFIDLLRIGMNEVSNLEKLRFSGWQEDYWGRTEECINKKFKNTDERKKALQYLTILRRGIKARKVSHKWAFEKILPVAVKLAKDSDEFKDICKYFSSIKSNLDYTNYEISNLSDAVLEDFDDLRLLYDSVLPKISKQIRKAHSILKYHPGDVKFLVDVIATKEDSVRKAIKLQRKYGDFKLLYTPHVIARGYKDGMDEYYGIISASTTQEEKFEILPPDMKSKNFKPWLTVRERMAIKKAIYAKFKTTNERKETLRSIFTLLKESPVNFVGGYTFLRQKPTMTYRSRTRHKQIKYIFPELPLEIVRLSSNITELKEICDYLQILNKKLAQGVFHYSMPQIAKLAKNVTELKEASGYLLFIDGLIKNKNNMRGYEVVYEAVIAAESIVNLKEISNVLSKIYKIARETNNEYSVDGSINEGHIGKAVDIQKSYGDFVFNYEDGPTGMVTYDRQENEIEETVPVITITPLSHVSNLKLTPTLFLDTEVTTNPDNFKDALVKLKTNEGNIPIVLLTKETKDSLEAKLKGIDLKGVQFRTPKELGLEKLEWEKDERVSHIAEIDNLRCIPLTVSLCEKFKDLQNARDEL
ncbi:MAG: hypothetical protein P9L93_00825 [Candidatus Gorgyraea atricola]|nr:hypothetical protein [Candidatus Gorgyraea atricola]